MTNTKSNRVSNDRSKYGWPALMAITGLMTTVGLGACDDLDGDRLLQDEELDREDEGCSTPPAPGAELIWQKDSGLVHHWNLFEGSIVNGVDIAHPDDAWRVVGSGDIDGNGHDDVVLLHDDGILHVWPMQDGRVIDGGGQDIISNVGNADVVALSDLNGDGRDDIRLS